MPRINARSSRPKLKLEHLEGRDVPAVLTIPTFADGLVADVNLDGAFDLVIDNASTISDRWFATAGIGQERGVFEFHLGGIAPGTVINSPSFGFDAQSFTSSTVNAVTTFPRLVLQSYAGDGAVTLADGNAA